ncbi:hypothetical protein [Pseudalkalibacillus caeni]|uniref:Uncharacterized protein n=1 Tax=Exobacillus caeni TaxID=2574798 RepID=A0A5R9F2C1_9BACL|nr:hypothetical protein [Pseudalkalibacillus caeni]TLS37231.1 hypothetical protein FCL54_11950 [Pseudalkalibacillus caeni]
MKSFIRNVLLLSVVFYLVFSMPDIFGVGYVIDFEKEVSTGEKALRYLGEGLSINVMIKLILAVLGGVFFSLYFYLKKLERKRNNISEEK